MKSIKDLLSKESVISRWKKSFNESKKKQEEYIDTLDLKKLDNLKRKSISDLTDDDLIFLDFEKTPNEDFELLYSYQGVDSLIKIYFNRLPNRFEQRGYLLKKEKDIFTVEELIESSLLSWRLGGIGKEPDYEARW